MKCTNVGIARGALVTCLGLAVTGCEGGTQLLQGESGEQVTVKELDPTPPSGITLETQGRAGGDVTLGVGSTPLSINIGRGDSFLLRAVAEDAEGIKEVAIFGTSEKVCVDPATGTASGTGPGLSGGPMIKDMSSATVDGEASSVRYVSNVVKADISCPATLRFLSQRFVFFGEATNFSSLRTRGPGLTVTVK